MNLLVGHSVAHEDVDFIRDVVLERFRRDTGTGGDIDNEQIASFREVVRECLCLGGDLPLSHETPIQPAALAQPENCRGHARRVVFVASENGAAESQEQSREHHIVGDHLALPVAERRRQRRVGERRLAVPSRD